MFSLPVRGWLEAPRDSHVFLPNNTAFHLSRKTTKKLSQKLRTADPNLDGVYLFFTLPWVIPYLKVKSNTNTKYKCQESKDSDIFYPTGIVIHDMIIIGEYSFIPWTRRK